MPVNAINDTGLVYKRVYEFVKTNAGEEILQDGFILNNTKKWRAKDGHSTLFLYELEDKKGFVIVSGDSCPAWIPAFSFNSHIYPDDLPPAMEWMIKSYLNVLEQSRLSESCKNNISEIELTTSGITPMISSKWDQRCFYNDSCPADPLAPAYHCGKVPAGCVATAIAQIMKYYKWPLQGSGTKSYNHYKYGQLSANFASTTYNIPFMPDELFSPNPDVARLLFHAGIAAQMNYGPYASGTSITDARTALVNHFRYKPSAQIISKSNYSSVAWKTTLRNEIDNGRPVFYSGVDQSTSTGHAFVLDGYWGNDHFHFNWGWSGIADGYYALNDLNPLAGANYNTFQEAIIGIEPLGDAITASFSANKQNINAGENITFTDLSTGSIANWEWSFEGGTPANHTGKTPPPIRYDHSGTYNVILIVENSSNNFDTIIKNNYIKVLPLANFTSSETSTDINGEIVFFDASESNVPIQNYTWHFFGGQPKISYLKDPPPVKYQSSGQYPVLLQVNDGANTDYDLKLQYVTVYNNCDTLLDFYMPGWFIQPANQATFDVYQEDLDSLIPYHNQYISSGWDFFTEPDNNVFISATSLFMTPGKANNWLIFGPITIPGNGATLQWKHKYPDHTKRDGYEIIISTSGYTHEHFTSTACFSVADNDPFTLGDTLWTKNSVSIDSNLYGNTDIFVGVNHNADNMFYIALDDFRIISCDGFNNFVDFFSFDTIITVGDTAEFFNFCAGKPNNLNWSFPGGVQINYDNDKPLVTYDQPGVYDVTLDALYQGSSSSITKQNYVEVKPISVNDQYEMLQSLTIFPNPFNSSIYLKGLSEKINYSIIDITGREVASGDNIPGIAINLDDLSKGVYFIKITLNDNISIAKRIVKGTTN